MARAMNGGATHAGASSAAASSTPPTTPTSFAELGLGDLDLSDLDAFATPRALTDLNAEIAAAANRAAESAEQLKALRSRASSSDGAVTVVVSALGALEDLSFGPAANDMDLQTLAALVKSTCQSARIGAAHDVQATVADLVIGTDSERLIAEYIPADVLASADRASDAVRDTYNEDAEADVRHVGESAPTPRYGARRVSEEFLRDGGPDS